MFRWNKENIEWFSRAASESNFHKELATKILPYLQKDDSVIDLGAGLGYLDREISPSVKKITLVDDNPNAVSFLKEKQLKNMEIILSNWEELDLKADYVLLSFFSRMYIKDTYENFMKICKKGIIYIQNEKRSNIDQFIEYLDKKEANYSHERYSLSFDQRLKKNEIEPFINCYYKSKTEIEKEQIKKSIIKINEDNYIFKNHKKIAVFIIRKGEYK